MITANDIRIVIMTVRRSPEYVHKTLASLLLSDPLVHQVKGIHLVVGSADVEYLSQYQHHKNIQIHPMPFDDAEQSRDWVIHRKFCMNYYRCLTVPVQNCHGICICEDDIAFQDGFIELMLAALNELEQEHKQDAYLLNLYVTNDLAPDAGFITGKTIKKYIPTGFYGTQCIYYPQSMIAPIAQLIYDQGVAQYLCPGDLLIGKYMCATNTLYGPLYSLVQHMGFQSTGLAGMFHRSYSFNTTAQPANGEASGDEVSFDLYETVGGVVKKLYAAQSKGLEVMIDILPGVPEKVTGKQTVLHSLLCELMILAIKCTNQGEVIVRIQVESIAGNDLYLHFTITDTGSSRQKKIFESLCYETPVREEDNELANDLSYCSSLAGKLGGELWIEVEEGEAPREGEGCILHFTGQLQIPRHHVLPSTSRVPHELRGLSVLIVDDNCSHRNLLMHLLTNWGMQVHTAESGALAMELLQKNMLAGSPFWIVLLDASMPGPNGFTVAKQIQDHPELARSILMMISSDIQGDLALLCREVGIHHYLNKPILRSELMEAFRYFADHTVSSL